MNNVFNNNLLNIRHGNSLLAIFTISLVFFPLLFEERPFEDRLIKACFFIGVAIFAAASSFLANYLMQLINVRKRYIYTLMVLFYSIVIFFGAYIDVWSNVDKTAGLYSCLLICSLLLFVNPPQFNLCLTISGLAIFIVSAIIMKEPKLWVYDIANISIAGILSLYFSWHITKLRIGLEISTTKLEEERNKYVDQSITDELTQLRNRRDFNQTFQRFLSNYRASDDWICIALADIDFFKFYNDHYGHPKGDDCLRGIGGALNALNSLGVYAARVGGEEFALLWFEKDPSHVEKVVTHWTASIRDLKILHEKSKVSEYVTMSIGVYIVRCGTKHDTQTLYDLADKALYTAKSSGRNCTIVLGDEIKEYKITPKDN